MYVLKDRGHTVDEVEPDDGAVRDPPVIDRLTLPYDRISQRDEITDGRAGAQILQVRSRGTVLATGREGLVFLLGRIDFGVQFVQILLVELARDGFVDENHRILPERCVLLCRLEAINRPGAVGGGGDQPIRSRNLQPMDPRCVSNSTRIPGDKVIETMGNLANYRAEL